MDVKLFGPWQERRVPILEIDPDKGAQMREGLDSRKVAQYAERYREGITLPPVVLFHDGSSYHRADGAHRIVGARQADLSEISAHVYQGGAREAKLYAAGANADFGLDRTDETIRTSILTLLRDPEWYEWSDRAISRHVTCSHTTVGKLRRQVDEELAAAAKPAPAQPGLFDAPQELVVERDPEEPRLRRGADGRKIDTSKIGGAKKQAEEAERLQQLLAGARALGAQDAAKGLRSQGEMVRALGGCPAGKLGELWDTYRAALGEAQAAAAQEKTYQPLGGGAPGEALRGKPVGGPPLVPGAAAPAPAAPTADPPGEELVEEETPCRICGLGVCEDEEACLARAEEEDGESEEEDEDAGDEESAGEPPRGVALSVLQGMVNHLVSTDPARKAEVGAELLRLAGELGMQAADGVRLREAERNAAERERERAEQRERELQRRLFNLAAAWRQQGQDGPRADLVAILDGDEEEVAAVLGRAGGPPAAGHDLEAEVERLTAARQALVQARDEAQRQRDEARREVAELRAELEQRPPQAPAAAAPRETLCEEDGCTTYVPRPADGSLALCERHRPGARAAPARSSKDTPRPPRKVLGAGTAGADEDWRAMGRLWGSPAYILKEVESWGANAQDAEWIAATQLEHRAGLEWPDALRPAERAELLEGIQEALAGAVPPAPAAAAVDEAPVSDEEEAAAEKRCVKCGCTSHKACEGGCFWVTPTLCSLCAPPDEVTRKIQEASAALRGKRARALEIARERARLDAAGALPLRRARQSLLHVVAKQYGSMDAPLCKLVWQAYQEVWERAKAAPPAPAAEPPAAPTWQPASIGGAKAVHALPNVRATPPGLLDGEEIGHPPALCRQRPDYKSKGWTPRPGVALTCKGCLAATEGVS